MQYFILDKYHKMKELQKPNGYTNGAERL